MEKPTPIKLPYEIEREAEITRLRNIEERIAQDRKNGTLVRSVITFLQQFEVKIIEFNLYVDMHIPYSTISRTIKDIIRNKLRILNEFYFSYTGSNPYPLITECMNKNSADVDELQKLYQKISDLLTKLNNNMICISNKQIIFVRERIQEYDWT